VSARIAVLASGGGSNLQAILDHFDALGDDRPGDVVLVASDRPAAGALARARARGVATAVIRTGAHPEGTPLADLLHDARVDYVALAGYLRLVPADVVRAYADRIVNVHPALLPAFGGTGMYGRRVHEAVIAAGAAETGPTVHFVDERFDHGDVIAQWSIPVRPGDTADSLAARVLRVEHVLYPRVVQALAAGAIRPGEPPRAGRSTQKQNADTDDRHLAQEIDDALGL
jgi:phosphoribosylglycinamide formyltransferase 1